MTRSLLALPIILALLVACAEPPAPPQPQQPRPVKTFIVEGGRGGAVRTFPARIDAAQRAELSFRVAGRLQQLLVKEGDLVETGQVLARLDPSDYEIVLEDRQASFDNAERNYRRGQELVEDGNISRLDFDRMEADYRTTTAALNQAQQDLDYTVLRAPFSGRIARREVENFEEVNAKQTVLWLQNIEQLDVVIDLPESVVRSVRGHSAAAERDDLGDGDVAGTVRAYVKFEGREETEMPIRPKEIATKADDKTQTFRATFTMSPPEDFPVLPGMTASAVIDLSSVMSNEGDKWVPARAVQSDNNLKPRVWLLDAASMTVSSRPVTIGRMSGSLIQVMSGLEGGEEVIAVGAPYLDEGMAVTRMAKTEQAQADTGLPR